MGRYVDPHKQSSRSGAKPGQRGFTLVEVLVTLVVVAIAAVITIPTLQRTRVKTSSSQALRMVSAAFDMARFEAVKRHSPVGVIFDSAAKPPVIVVFEDWDPEQAWDPASVGGTSTNGNGVLDSNEQTLDSRLIPNEFFIVAKPAGDSTPDAQISTVVYAFDGSLRSGGGAAYFSDKRGNIFRVRINAITGDVREEGWLAEESKWTPKKEAWEWKF